MSARKTLACVTMVYNERDMLPLWLRHYGRQAGSAACYVIDHGSDDGSTEELGTTTRQRLARTPLDEPWRAAYVGLVCAELLRQYDYVAYVDADEMLVADPARWDSLLDFVNDTPAPVTTAFGMNLLHLIGDEAEWNPARPILAQRRWAFPLAAMCKPALIGEPVAWSPGFHSADAPIVFGGLFLFHLAYFDDGTAMRRQHKRRSQSFADEMTSTHHRAADDIVRGWMQGWSRMPCDEGVNLSAECPYRACFQDRVIASQVGREGDTYRIDLGLAHYRRWRVPERFAHVF